MKRQQRSIGRGRLFAYGTLAFPLATIGLPLSIYLAPFYAGEVGLPLAALGTAMIAARLVDVVVDPAIGALSDRWRPRIGRRKVWLPIGIAVMLLGVWKLFNPVPPVGIGYFLGWVTVVYVGFTATKLPYEAWGAELADDYAGRTRVASVRQFYTLAGLVVACIIPALVLARPGATAADVLHGLGGAMLVLLPLAGLLVFAFVPDPNAAGEASGGTRRAIGQLWRNGPFKRIGLALFLGYIAETFRITITLFFARDIIGVPNIGIIYVWYFATGLVAVPVWLWLGNRIGKHRALALAFGVVIATNTAIFFIPRGAVTVFTLLFVAKGFCFGALELLPAAMIADTADVDTVMSRARRQGLFFAAVGIAIKLGQAIGQGLSLNLLAAVGYRAAGGNGTAALDGLRMLYCFAPTLLLAPGLWLAWHYPLTASRHAAVRAFLDRRAAPRDRARPP